MVQHLESCSSANSWHPGAGIKRRGEKSYLREEGEEVRGSRTEGSPPAVGDEGQASVSLTPDVDAMNVCIFKVHSLKGHM